MELLNTNEAYSQEYLTFKKELDTELNKAAEGFVKIGYLLRCAEDSDILLTSGYRNVTEFAAAEYGLTKDVVSRYININKRYSEGGYAPVLASRYRNFGMAKLAEMLTLPDVVVDAIPDELSKTDIREIKKEYDEEMKISDIEVAIEAAEVEDEKGIEKQEEEIKLDETERCLLDVVKLWLYDNPKEFALCAALLAEEYDIEKIKDIVAPDETRVIIVRVPGTGKLMMTCEWTGNIKLINMRSQEHIEATWETFASVIGVLLARKYEAETMKEIWMRIFNEPYQEEAKTEQNEATNQKEKKTEKRKQSKVVVARSKKEVKKEPEKNKEVAPVQPPALPQEQVEAAGSEKQSEAAERKAEKSRVNTQYFCDIENMFKGIEKNYEDFVEAVEEEKGIQEEKEKLINSMQVMIQKLGEL